MSGNRLAALVFLAFLLIVSTSAEAATSARRSTDAWCGTDQEPTDLAIERHRFHQRRLDREFAASVKSGQLGKVLQTEVRKEGNVAVLLDSGRVVREDNPADVSDLGLDFKFKKKKGGYTVVGAGGGVSGELGDKLDLRDDDTREIDLPFKIRFYGKKYSSIFVNSDGNITFGEGDVEISPRDMARMLAGAPRISPFFRDLNPETATGDGGVYVSIANKSVKVTWLRVPEFDDTGLNDTLNTFEATISKKGRVVFRFGELQSLYAIVGLSPGGGSGVDLVDYTDELPTPVLRRAIAEDFLEESTADIVALAQVVLERLRDRYMQLVVFTDFPLVLNEDPFTLAFHQPIANQVRGLGRDVFNFSRFFGSGGALEGLVMMGELTKYGGDAEDPRFINGVFSALDILMHEIGHRWGMRGVFFEKDGEIKDDLLGRGDPKSHWSFCFNSENSYLEGNALTDNGDGTFVSTVGRARFNAVNRYLMGLAPPEDVGELFYVDNCNGDRAPQFNVTLSGSRVDVTIDDIIRALGARDPAFGDAPTKFNIAFVLLTRDGQAPSADAIARVDEFRKLAMARFAEAGGKLNTSIKLK